MNIHCLCTHAASARQFLICSITTVSYQVSPSPALTCSTATIPWQNSYLSKSCFFFPALSDRSPLHTRSGSQTWMCSRITRELFLKHRFLPNPNFQKWGQSHLYCLQVLQMAFYYQSGSSGGTRVLELQDKVQT